MKHRKKWKKARRKEERKRRKLEKLLREREEVSLQIMWSLNPGIFEQTGGDKCEDPDISCGNMCFGCVCSTVPDLSEPETVEKLPEVEVWRQRKP